MRGVKDTTPGISDLAGKAQDALQELSYPLSKLANAHNQPGTAEGFNGDEKLAKAIEMLTAVKETIEVERAATKEHIDGILDTPHGQKLDEARTAFNDLDDAIRKNCNIPKVNEYIYEYDVNGSAPTLSANPEDLTTVYELSIGHYQSWGDGDFDHGAGKTEIKITLAENAEEIGIEVTGDEIDDKDFKKRMMDFIDEIAAAAYLGRQDYLERRAAKKPEKPAERPREYRPQEPTRLEKIVNGVTIILGSESGLYYLQFPGANGSKISNKMKYEDRIYLKACASNWLERAEQLAKQGKPVDDVYMEIATLVR